MDYFGLGCFTMPDGGVFLIRRLRAWKSPVHGNEQYQP